ncbi:hypothetical protein QYE77_04075 [Thermanaerothrix sp. 4228-RoL]|uniref:Uncharacterized protein n=1 Tax=Thermanaerothrix solaris TaxID=3058434 RepID=A0ABU3NKQ9_9CHLR|nr:hypothetical protein [Thermanaerothrix sp. 4228-RoL]MDT8897433.1 hypothetical protein [Thermanaerothrix sp. 4228-RoL]
MSFGPEVKAAIVRELEQGERARNAGNEAQARVCARRAVGIALRAFWDEDASYTPSVIPLLQRLQETKSLPQSLRNVAEHFLMRVTPEFRLPVDVDLLAEARWLVEELERLKSAEAANENQTD